MNDSTTFRYTTYIPFHLCDPAGILFFGHVFSLAHQAYEHLIQEEWKLSWAFWFQNPEWILPIRQTEAQFIAPLRAGRDCVIELAVQHFSLSSFTLKSALFQEALCCEVTTVHVFCERASLKKRDIPQEVLFLLEKSCNRSSMSLPTPRQHYTGKRNQKDPKKSKKINEGAK